MHRPQLPPPDPNECDATVLPDLELAEPTMWFPLGRPSEADERLAATVLAHRPGALLVYDTRQ
jgi:hypothetical protein